MNEDGNDEADAIWLDMMRRAADLQTTGAVSTAVPLGYPAPPPVAVDEDADAATADRYGRVWWRALKLSERLGGDDEEQVTFRDIAEDWFEIRDNAAAPAATPAHVTVNVHAGRPQLPPKSVGVAYGLWALSLIGIAGIHRMYIGKVGTGILWLLTAGIFFIGTIIDVFTLASQVRAANARRAVGIK